MTQPTKFQPPPPTTSSNSNATILPPTINQVTYFGRVYTLYDAMLLVEACRLNILPTIDRRLTTFERLKLIKPNSIFIWNEQTVNYGQRQKSYLVISCSIAKSTRVQRRQKLMD